MDLRELSVTRMGAGRHPWELARADAVEFLLRRRGGVGGEGVKILDFGCGDAFLASVLTTRFGMSEVYAVDKAFTPETCSRLAGTLSDRVHLFDSLDTLEAGKIPHTSLVLLLDVLEHCEQDIEVLERVVRSPVVAPGTAFLITVPAFQGLFCEHDRFLGHYRRYRLEQLALLARKAELIVKEKSYFFSSLLLPRGLSVAAERLGAKAKVYKGIGNHRAKPFLDSLVRRVLWADFRACETLARRGIYMPGLSCFVLARKSE